jgi:hypothetical protein
MGTLTQPRSITLLSQNYDAVRREQAAEGQRMARTEGTLHRKGPKKPQQGNAQRKPELKGHEFFLKELEKSGARISVLFLDQDHEVIGTVMHSDKYTITLRTNTTIGQRDVVFFKSAIKGFYPLDLRAKEPADTDTTVH